MAKDDKLQRYFDGELTPEERAAFESAMTDDDRERLAALAEMRGLLANALEGDSGQIDVWSRVEAQLGGGSVVSIESARHGAKRKAGFWRTGRILGTSAGLLIAAAAAFLLVVQPWHPSHPTDNCDVETLEVMGGQATVLQMHDAPHKGDATTIIWTTEED